MPQSTAAFRLSNQIVHALNDLRGMLRRYVTVHGLLLITVWLAVVFWVGGIIDYVPVTMGSNETPRWLRIGLLVVMVAGSGWILLRWVLARLWVRLEDRSLALLIERKYPQLKNELVTVVELSGKPVEEISNPDAHRAMLDKVHLSASQHIKSVRTSELFDWQPMWTVGVAAVFGLIVTGIAALGMSDWTGRWARRLFILSDEPWPRMATLRADGVQLQFPAFSTQLSAERKMLPFVDGIVRVPVGAAPLLQISADTGARQIPDICTLFYRSEDGSRGRANLRRVGSPRDAWQQFTLDGPPLDSLSSTMKLDVVGLDARLRDLQIQVVESAVIADMKLACQYPAYLQDSFSSRASVETIAYRNGATVPEGTAVELVGTASNRLSRVEYLVLGPNPADNSVEINSQANSIQTILPNENSFRIPLGKLSASAVVEVRLIDEFGLSSEQIPRYVITIQPDLIPEVDSRLEGIGLAVTPVAMLPLQASVEDDHGIQSVSAELVIDASETTQIPLALTDDRQKSQLEATLDLIELKEQLQLPIEPGMTLGLVVAATDFFDLGQQPHIGRGQPLQLSVVTTQQLLVMLDRQEIETRQRLELIMSELEQLREVLQTMKTDLQPPSAADSARISNASATLITLATLPQSGEADGDAEVKKRESRTQQTQRLAGLWTQQSILQADKSQQELSSLAARIDNLRLQLINNRIDSYDQQERLQTKVTVPLRELLAGEYESLRKGLNLLQSATLAGGGGEQAGLALRALEAVLIKLEAIKLNMQDIEDLSEIQELVRVLLEDQEKILSETEAEQRRRILDLLK